MPTRPLLTSLAVAVTVALSACSTSPTDREDGVSVVPSSTPDPSSSSASADPDPAAAVVAAADAFLDTLAPDQVDRVLHDADDPALRDWIYFPSTSDRSGVALGDLDDEQRAAALAVAAAVLSDEGYEQLRGVLAAEDELGRRNGEESTVNAGRYFIAFFGTPAADERFTVQFTGHHLAVNTTYDGDRVSPTPAFTGVDPVAVELDGRRTRPMQVKVDAVSALLTGLDEGRLAAARIGAIDDVRVGTGASEDYPDPEGTLVADLDDAERQLVVAVVRAWVGDTDERVAGPLVEQYLAQLDRTRIAWSGSTDPDVSGSYLRLDGPRLWIEFSNVGRFGNGDDHYHSVYRDREIDYLAGE